MSDTVGDAEDGAEVGDIEGFRDGMQVGCLVGRAEGDDVGFIVDGREVGWPVVGSGVGAIVDRKHTDPPSTDVKPEGQLAHAVAPDTLEYLPIAQLTHADRADVPEY